MKKNYLIIALFLLVLVNGCSKTVVPVASSEGSVWTALDGKYLTSCFPIDEGVYGRYFTELNNGVQYMAMLVYGDSEDCSSEYVLVSTADEEVISEPFAAYEFSPLTITGMPENIIALSSVSLVEGLNDMVYFVSLEEEGGAISLLLGNDIDIGICSTWSECTTEHPDLVAYADDPFTMPDGLDTDDYNYLYASHVDDLP